MHVGERVVAAGFEVDEEDEGLGRVFVEDAVAGGFAEVVFWVHFVEEIHKRVDVEVSESAVCGEGGGVVADVEFFVEEPDVCFHARAAPVDGVEERDAAPVVVVRVAGDRDDVSRCVGWVFDQAFACVAWLAPLWKKFRLEDFRVPKEAGSAYEGFCHMQDAASAGSVSRCIRVRVGLALTTLSESE